MAHNVLNVREAIAVIKTTVGFFAEESGRVGNLIHSWLGVITGLGDCFDKIHGSKYVSRHRAILQKSVILFQFV